MTVRELMEQLEAEDPAAEVRIMTQSSWPFEHSLQTNLFVPSPERCLECGETRAEHGDGHEFEEDGNDEAAFTPKDGFTDDHEGPVVYLVEGSQEGYGTKAAWS